MAVATKLLAVGTTSAASDKLVYTTPAGHTTIVKHVVFSNYGPNPQDVALTFGLPSGERWTVALSNFATWEAQSFDLWAVLPAGYRMGVFALTVQPAVYWISGSELIGVPDLATVPTLEPGLVVGSWPGQLL